MALFYLWGRWFTGFIHADQDIASCIAFGYLVLQVIYQAIYLPFFLSKGSYRMVSYSWIVVVVIASVFLVLNLKKNPCKKITLKKREKLGLGLASIMVIGLAAYISLHVPFYGADTETYISRMNDAYYMDSMWVRWGSLSVHHGLCSMFHFFTVSSLLTGIKPYYISLFTVRITGVCMSSMIVYKIGCTIFKRKGASFCWPAVVLSVLCPVLLLLWGSNYTAEFFYWRINEAKGYCQFVLLPEGFSVFLEMLKSENSRKIAWKKQMLIGLAAMPVSSSSMTPYIFLVIMGTVAILAFDKLKDGWRTIGNAVICSLPNLLYLILYVLEQKQVISF